ncbi:UV DNA damage endonuclease [Bacillus sp. JCM 19046]|nr:UV DNA damage endonuclease [Bacillus sp. JCM 19045]GAF19759.1 UV DNA damage endonuclease [Bacillus sp. JCM 19046]
MELGYACLNLTLPSQFRTCRLATMRQEGMAKIKELTLHNIAQVEAMLSFNEQHQIRFLRLSSDIVPFATHPEMNWEWAKDEEVLERLALIKTKKKEQGLRFSMHPGQYTVLNSPREQVVENAKLDLGYHSQLLDLVGGTDIIIHTGGAYGDKEKAKKTFVEVYQTLPDDVKEKIRLENDDKTFHTRDVLDIHHQSGVTICFDIHHERCFHTEEDDLKTLYAEVAKTWMMKPKVHISSGKDSTSDPRHRDYIELADFQVLKRVLGDIDTDVMLEAKAKEKALLSLRQQVLETEGENDGD